MTEEATAIEEVIAAHDLSEEHAARVRELVEEGTPVLDAIREAASVEPTEPPPVEPSDDAAAGLAEPSEKMLRDLAKEIERHEKSVRKTMGSFVDGFDACSTCGGLGLEQPGPKPLAHEFFKECPTCAGYGEVLSGSRVEGKIGVACPDCMGNGYLMLLVDNTPAGELVKQWREARRASQAPVIPVAPAVPGEVAAVGEGYGLPAWMGNPDLT